MKTPENRGWRENRPMTFNIALLFIWLSDPLPHWASLHRHLHYDTILKCLSCMWGNDKYAQLQSTKHIKSVFCTKTFSYYEYIYRRSNHPSCDLIRVTSRSSRVCSEFCSLVCSSTSFVLNEIQGTIMSICTWTQLSRVLIESNRCQSKLKKTLVDSEQIKSKSSLQFRRQLMDVVAIRPARMLSIIKDWILNWFL